MDNDYKSGISYPPIDKLLEKINSKYKLAYTAGKVAEIIDKEKNEHKDSSHTKIENHKSVSIALEDILEGKVKIHFKY